MQALTLSYYTDCLQPLIESLEVHLDDGLALPLGQGTELDIDNLLRMDTQGMAEATGKIVGAGVMAPNEGRAKFNLPKVKGGDSPYLQQQNYSLEALAKRDALADPFGKTPPAAPEAPQPPQTEEPAEDETDRAVLVLNIRTAEEIAFGKV
jgi:phage portal protein BeeE